MSVTLNNAPLDKDDFAQAVKSCAPISPLVALAVSGGPDSMALAFCAKRAGYRCLALIVDHALRPESAKEAARTKDVLKKMGLDAEILHWQHENVASAVHEKARAARYNLLVDACRRHGITDLFTAHHADDQAETILMRFVKGSAAEGLSGMARQSRRGAVRLLRPFLAFPKARLVATCITHNISFISDSSNASDRFARGRLRKIMPLLAQEGLTAAALLRVGMRASEEAAALAIMAHEFLRQSARFEENGSIHVDRRALSALPRAVFLRAIGRCLRVINADDYPPRPDRVAAVCDDILTLSIRTTRSLYGCLIVITPSSVVLFREPAAATEIVSWCGGQSVLWDKRWRVTSDIATATGELRALGTARHALIDRLAPTLRRDVPWGRMRASLPALWQEDKIIAIPCFKAKAGFYATPAKELFPSSP